MNKTKKSYSGIDINDSEKLTVDTEELKALLSCGRKTAIKIGEDSCARVQIGRRVLWSVERVKAYLREQAA